MKHPREAVLRESLNLWLGCLLELLLCMPVWIAVQIYVLPHPADKFWLYLLPLMSLAGVALRIRCTARWKQVLYALLPSLVIGAVSAGFTLQMLPMTSIAFICIYLGITADARSNKLSVYAAGITVNFIAVIIFRHIPELRESITLLTWSGCISVIFTLLAYNTEHLRYSSFSNGMAPLPHGLKRRNRLWVVLFILLAAVLALGLGSPLVKMLWIVVRGFFQWLRGMFPAPDEPAVQEEAPPEPVMPEMPGADEIQEPGLLAAILDRVIVILFALVLLFAIYYGVKWLRRNAGGILRKASDAILSLLRRERQPRTQKAYADEEKSIFTWEKTLGNYNQLWHWRFRTASRRERWEEMNGGGEQVRWLYRKWLRTIQNQGYEAKNCLTPQETGQDYSDWANNKDVSHRSRVGRREEAPVRLLELYDQVRYGEDNPPEAEARAVKEQLKL